MLGGIFMQDENDAKGSVGDKKPNAVPPDGGHLYANAGLIPPVKLLFDGTSSVEEFVEVGEGFTREYLRLRAKLLPGERVLDLGSGNGQKARVLAQYLNQTGSYEGLDIVRSGIEWCRRAYARFPNFTFTLAENLYNSHYNPDGYILADEYRLPYNDAEFDLVFCASLFTHLLPYETQNYVAEIARVLKPRGRFVMTAFLLNSDSSRTVAEGTIKFPVECSGYRIAQADNPSEAVALPESFMREALENRGMRICEITYGFWAGGLDLLSALQDCVMAVKTPN